MEPCWRIAPRQQLHFIGWDWENVLVFAEGSGNTHQLSPLAAAVLQILYENSRHDGQDSGYTAHQLLTELVNDWPSGEGADLSTALDEALRGLLRIGLVRKRRLPA